MFKLVTKEPTRANRSLEELRKQLRTIETDRLRQIKGGQGAKRVPLVLKSCGGWLPQ